MGDEGLIPSQYEALVDDVECGDRILLDDGKIEIRVESIEGSEVRCRVVHGGILRDKKGMNLPGVSVSAPSLTDKDKEDARFAMQLGIDFLALSFVRSADDVIDLRRIVEGQGATTGIIAKFEKPEALINAADIIGASDAIMVARGDLGVELTPEQVPIAQRKLIDMARDFNRPVIVATQMLESMMNTTRPSRAEVSDVSQAVVAGVDAVMLSGETASGQFPVQTVQMMSRVIHQTEVYLFDENNFADLARKIDSKKTVPFGHAVAHAAADLVEKINAKAILSLSNSGMSAVTISSERPSAPLLAISSDPVTCRRVNLQWGTLPVLAEEAGESHPNILARQIAKEAGLAQAGDYIVLVRGFHSEMELNTPSITLLTI